MARMLEIDGSLGEGGGQVLRTALALSAATGRAVRIRNVRAGRPAPGLLRPHLSAVRAAAAVTDAAVDGAAIGSGEIVFRPRALRPGRHEFCVGTGASCLAILQTILPSLLLADEPSEIVLEGGTHTPDAPPWEFIERAWFPALRIMGAGIEGRLERHGFAPAGGGRVVVSVTHGQPRPFEAIERGQITERRAEAVFANLPLDIATRELETLGQRLNLADSERKLREVKSTGPGNALVLSLVHGAGTEVIADYAMPSRSAETVAKLVAREAGVFLASTAATGRHLAEQLLVPMATRAGGRLTTVKLGRHASATVAVIQRFAPGAVEIYSHDSHIALRTAPIGDPR